MTTFLFLPHGDADWSWLRVEGDRVAAAGSGAPVTDGPVVAVAPADAVTLHWATLPDRSRAQATAAARLLAGEASVTPLTELHVAVGDEGGERSGGEQPVAVVALATMRDWLDQLAAHAIDAVALLPAPLLLPPPAEGFVRAEVAGQGLVRGPSCGFADHAALTDLVTGGVVPTTLDAAQVDAMLAAAAARPAMDLRQGLFARRRRFGVDWRLVRRLATLGCLILAATLARDVVRIIRFDLAADAAEARADELARSGLPRGVTVTDPDRQLTERLAAVRGAGRGFSATAAAVAAAIRTVPGSEMTGLTFDPDGNLEVQLATQQEAAATDLKRAIEANGFAVRAGVFQSAGGRVTGQFTVTPR